METIIDDAEVRMQKTLNFLKRELANIHTGRATPRMVEDIKVSAYGSELPIKQVATISIPEPRLIIISPWDKSLLTEIERAIQRANIGINPQNDGQVIRLVVPPLSEERRRGMVDLVKRITEQHRVALRNIRRDVIDKLRKMKKEGELSEDDAKRLEKQIDDLTKDYIGKADELMETKINELLEG
ncbi:ribosome recycling factor [candidate division WOR-3 bacterium]|nr:ribosome recycling factor [candidate division WOR-3 bacterium]